MEIRPNHAIRTIVYAALLMGLGLSCAAHMKAPASALTDIDITGTWKADIETPDGDMEVILNISKSEDSMFSATMDVPVMGAFDFPITFSYEDGVVHYEIEQVGADFKGKLTDSSTLEGIAGSGTGDSGPITFKRVEE